MKTKRSNILGKLALAAVVGAVMPGCDRTATAVHLESATLAPFVEQVARPILAQATEDLIPPDAARADDPPKVREVHMPLAWIYGHAPQKDRGTDALAALDRDLRPGASPTIAEALSFGGVPRALPLARTADAKLSPEGVARALRVADDRIEACYATVLRDQPSAAGDVDVGFVVGHDGRVKTIHEHTRDRSAVPILPCVANGFVGLQLAPPASRFVEVTRTLSLHG